jgi:hypothetical protein
MKFPCLVSFLLLLWAGFTYLTYSGVLSARNFIMDVVEDKLLINLEKGNLSHLGLQAAPYQLSKRTVVYPDCEKTARMQPNSGRTSRIDYMIGLQTHGKV